MAATKPTKRIKLSGGKAIVENETSAPSNSSQKSSRSFSARSLLFPFTAPYGYVKGSWQELRQVRWPNRKATWSLTLAVILFTLFFVLIILLLDAAFQFLFKEVLLKS